MPTFYTKLLGAEQDPHPSEHPNVDKARDAAIERLGAYLQENPKYAYDGHWQVEVRDDRQRVLLRVIVATVMSPSPLNWASFEN